MILLDNIIFDLQAAGGISKAWAKHVELITKLRSDVMLLEGPKAKRNHFRQAIEIPSERIVVDRGPSFFRLLRPVRHEAALFHSSYYRLANAGPKSVVTIHDFINELYPRSPRDLVLAAMKKRATKNADAIITVSQNTLSDMHGIHPWTRDKKTMVIANGVDKEFRPVREMESVTIAGREIEARRFLLYVGHRGHCKNFAACAHFMGHTLASELDLTLVVIGGQPISRPERRLLAEHFERDRVLWLPFAQPEELNMLYNHALALLFPSHYEGFGIPALEAARTGCIVLGAAVSSVPEVIGTSDFLFNPKDSGDMDRAFAMLEDRAKVDAESKRLIEHSKRFDWRRTSEQISALYEKLLG